MSRLKNTIRYQALATTGVLSLFFALASGSALAEPDSSTPVKMPPKMTAPAQREIKPLPVVVIDNKSAISNPLSNRRIQDLQVEKVLPSQTDEILPSLAEEIYEKGYDKGFVTLSVDYQKKRITARWAGTPPKDISTLANTAVSGITIQNVSNAGEPRERIDKGVDALNKNTAKTKIMTKLGIVGIDVSDDNSHVTFKIGNHRKLTQPEIDQLRNITGFQHFDLSYGNKEAIGYSSRGNDDAPWKGGARIKVNDSLCTSGFAVLTPQGAGRLLSARHCDPSGNATIRDGSGTVIAPGGNSVSVDGSVDSMLIDPTASPATAPRIYRGGINSSTTSVVKNWWSNWPKDQVCSSGASTGEWCGVVYDDNDFVSVGGFSVNVIQVQGTGKIMGGAGDSGAPIFKKLSNGVQARGILLGPDPAYPTSDTCPGAAPSCSRYINYVPISTILNSWKVKLEVG